MLPTMVHPATLLIAWAGCAFLLPELSLANAAVAAVLSSLVALWRAASRFRLILARARWLIFALALMFALFTPGVLVPALPVWLGLTQDGLLLAGEHVARLLVLLATLAVLHEHLGTAGLMTGLYWLLRPLAAWQGLRERIVIRLLLVIEFVESREPRDWRTWLAAADTGPEVLALPVRAAGLIDWLVLLALAAFLAVVGAGAW